MMFNIKDLSKKEEDRVREYSMKSGLTFREAAIVLYHQKGLGNYGFRREK